jgi:hypothetical protein
MAPQTRHSKPYDERENISNVPQNIFFKACDILRKYVKK